MANKSNYFPRRSSHFKNYKVILSGRGSHYHGQFVLDEIYRLVSDEEKRENDKLADEDNRKIIIHDEIKVSLYDDLYVKLTDIFDRI